MKIAPQGAPRSRRPAKSEAVILFSVSRQLFAIAADAVQEIRSTDSIAGAASELRQPPVPKVRHAFDRGHHQYFVVNAGAHFRLPVTRPTLVLILRRLRVALLVDRIEQMAEISAVFDLPRIFTGEELCWYRGLAYLNDHVIPVIDPKGFLTEQEFRTLDKFVGAQSVEGSRPGMSFFATAAPGSFVLLHIAGQRFALPANMIAELAPPVRLHSFPHTSPLLTGVIVRRGRIVPVFDAGRALSGKPSLGHRFYLIARQAFDETSETGAIPVDGDCELVSSNLFPPSESRPPYVCGEVVADGESVGVLDLQQLIQAHSVAPPSPGLEAQPRGAQP